MPRHCPQAEPAHQAHELLQRWWDETALQLVPGSERGNGLPLGPSVHTVYLGG